MLPDQKVFLQVVVGLDWQFDWLLMLKRDWTRFIEAIKPNINTLMKTQEICSDSNTQI